MKIEDLKKKLKSFGGASWKIWASNWENNKKKINKLTEELKNNGEFVYTIEKLIKNCKFSLENLISFEKI